MKILCVIPVHNRLDSTKSCVRDLLNQEFDGDLVVVVVDDGSTDGTLQYLKDLEEETSGYSKRVVACVGSGEWWWSRCINTGIDLFIDKLVPGDGVLLLNDDVSLEATYLARLTETWTIKGKSIVMSQLVDLCEPETWIDSSVMKDDRRLEIKSVNSFDDQHWTRSDLAPGRGTLYPAEVFIHGVRANQDGLPHYLSDYELSLRASRLGYPIFVAHEAKIKTEQHWGNAKRRGGLRWRMFAVESPESLKAYWNFWRVAVPELSRARLATRIILHRLLPITFEWIR